LNVNLRAKRRKRQLHSRNSPGFRVFFVPIYRLLVEEFGYFE
jgi:hypothetical protein